MKAKDLIKLLEEKIKEHEPHVSVMGELKIVIDRFEKIPNTSVFRYVGYDPNVELEFNSSNGDYILNAFASGKRSI